MRKKPLAVDEEVLRRYIKRCILSEAGGVGEEMDAQERAAKESYEAAVAELQAWDDNETKKQAFNARAKELGLAPDGSAARKKIKVDQKYNFIPTTRKRKTLEDELNKAEETYAEYNPEVRGFVRKRTIDTAKTTLDKSLPPEGKKVYVPIEKVKPLKWYEWPMSTLEKCDKSFGSAGMKTGEETSGTGPGEEWLSFIFGGQIQGGNVSYDIVTPDGRSWEVKALMRPTDQIRPGTEGVKVFDEPRKRLEKIMIQMKNFVTMSKKIEFSPKELSDVDRQILASVESFTDDEFEMIVSKGEIPRDRLVAIRATLRSIKAFKKFHSAKGHSDIDTRVGLNDKEVRVDKSTFIDVARRVERSTGDKNILSDVEKFDLLMSPLKDPAFDDYKEFFNTWVKSINISKVFEKVDGVIIVNARGYMMIPRSMFNDAIKFVRVSQGKPFFALTVPFGP